MCPTTPPTPDAIPPTPPLERGPDDSPIIELPAILDRARSEILNELAVVNDAVTASSDELTLWLGRRDELQRQLEHVDAAIATLDGHGSAAADGEARS